MSDEPHRMGERETREEKKNVRERMMSHSETISGDVLLTVIFRLMKHKAATENVQICMKNKV